jgi:amino-acid N-acetyltransferase
MFAIRQAEEKDVFQIKRLLKDAGVNDKGVEDFIEHFFVVEEVDNEDADVSQMVGAVDMEVYEEYGLLRSFVLQRASWNPKVGLQLIEILLSYAQKCKLSEVYMLAGESNAFFEQIGFQEISKEALPEAIKNSSHLKRSIPNGTPMVYSCVAVEGATTET